MAKMSGGAVVRGTSDGVGAKTESDFLQFLCIDGINERIPELWVRVPRVVVLEKKVKTAAEECL
jgi:hypothetical protein